jgi:NADH-quinone oxidoreductase subunit M
MILFWLIIVPLIGGILAWAAARSRPLLCRWISLVAVTIDLVLALCLAARDFIADRAGGNQWFEQVD